MQECLEVCLLHRIDQMLGQCAVVHGEQTDDDETDQPKPQLRPERDEVACQASKRVHIAAAGASREAYVVAGTFGTAPVPCSLLSAKIAAHAIPARRKTPRR